MNNIRRSREEIIDSLSKMEKANIDLASKLEKASDIKRYSCLVRTDKNKFEIWTDAIQRAIDENEVVIIPKGIYYVDKTLVVPSNRKIVAYGAHIKKIPEMNTLLLRNEHLRDGSYVKIDGKDSDENISVIGGIWEDTGTEWTFHHGLYDSENSMPGVSACMCFTNIKHLNVRDLKIIRAGGFGIQVGNLSFGVIENIVFENTVADGVHVNGNSRDIIIRNVSGSVGDDIVALNMYDWFASSVCFGPIENLLCENICLAENGRYKAIRILPGKYFYPDGSFSDCYLKDVIMRGIRGINTFKLYFQTPPYKISEKSESGESGWGDNLFLEDIEIDLNAPIDLFDEYVNGDRVLGSFGAFEFGSRLGRVELSDIKMKIYKEKFPTSYFAVIGPKSIRRGEKEIFDPYINSSLEELVLKNVSVNGEPLNSENSEKYIHEIVFEDIWSENMPASRGEFKKVIFK